MENFEKEIDQRIPVPLCWACGEQMEWSGDFRELEFDGGQYIIEEPIYFCVNPECHGYEEDD